MGDPEADELLPGSDAEHPGCLSRETSLCRSSSLVQVVSDSVQ